MMYRDRAKMIEWYAKKNIEHRMLAQSVTDLLESYLDEGAVEYALVEHAVKEYEQIQREARDTKRQPDSISDIVTVRVLVYDSRQMATLDSVVRGLFDIFSIPAEDQWSREYEAGYGPVRLGLLEYQRFAGKRFHIIVCHLLHDAYTATIRHFERAAGGLCSAEYEKRKNILGGLAELAGRELEGIERDIYSGAGQAPVRDMSHATRRKHDPIEVIDRKGGCVSPYSQTLPESVKKLSQPHTKAAGIVPDVETISEKADESPTQQSYSEEHALEYPVEFPASELTYVPVSGKGPAKLHIPKKKSTVFDMSAPLTSLSLRDYMTAKFENVPYLDCHFGKNDSTILLRELSAMGITTVGGLDGIVTKDFIEKNRLYEHRSNFTGLLRQIMVVYDADTYFKKAWDRHWDVFVFKSKNEHDLYDSFNVDIDGYAKEYDFEVQYAYLDAPAQ